jgi:hypothetical protein
VARQIDESGACFRRNRAGLTVLELRPGCECCDKDLPPAAADAMICSFECTFCRDCAEHRFKGVCPNCGGNLSPRPIRAATKLAVHPPSPVRVFNPAGCGGAVRN